MGNVKPLYTAPVSNNVSIRVRTEEWGASRWSESEEGPGPECCQLCWLRDDEESGVRTWSSWWHPGSDNTETSDTMFTFPLVLVTGKAYTYSEIFSHPVLITNGSILTFSQYQAIFSFDILPGFCVSYSYIWRYAFVYFSGEAKSISECQQNWTFLEWCG